jgi:hypothetical protein
MATGTMSAWNLGGRHSRTRTSHCPQSKGDHSSISFSCSSAEASLPFLEFFEKNMQNNNNSDIRTRIITIQIYADQTTITKKMLLTSFSFLVVGSQNAENAKQVKCR